MDRVRFRGREPGSPPAAFLRFVDFAFESSGSPFASVSSGLASGLGNSVAEAAGGAAACIKITDTQGAGTESLHDTSLVLWTSRPAQIDRAEIREPSCSYACAMHKNR